MTPIRSSDHAECSRHCSLFGTTALCSAWTIRGSGPACCRRLASVHAEHSASHIISLRERVSIRETLSPLDEPSIFREKARWRRRSGGSARRDAADPPLVASGGRGYRLRPWSGFPDQTGLCETGASRTGVVCLTRGPSDRGYLICGVLVRGGILGGMSRTRWQGRDRQRLRQLVTDSYGWTCTLCHRPIDPHATALRDRLSIDHVLPVSRGGSDSLENLRPTHHGCNSAKRDGRRLRRRATETAPGFFSAGPPGSLPPPKISPQ